MDQAKIAVIEKTYAEWVSGDYSHAEFIHPTFELVFARGFLDEGVYSGASSALKGWQGWLDQWASWTYVPVGYVDVDENCVGVLIDVNGEAKSTGLPLEFNTGNVWEFEDGLIRRVTLYAHREDMFADLGLDPP